MKKNELYNFGNYEVFYYIKGNKITLCVCDDFHIAQTIAICLAKADTIHDHYFVSAISKSDEDLITGGGNYDEYWFDENRKLNHVSLG